ncbi:MAG TPA: hypothetical protein VF733_02710 [Candidatus Saccharimonadales bacterium]
MSEALGDEEPIVMETGLNFDGVEDWTALRDLEPTNNEGEE